MLVHQVEDVGKAHPRLVEVVETMVKKGKWTVPGTSCIRFFLSALLIYIRHPQGIKRSLVTLISCNHLPIVIE